MLYTLGQVSLQERLLNTFKKLFAKQVKSFLLLLDLDPFILQCSLHNIKYIKFIGRSRGACWAHIPPMGPNSFIFVYIFAKKAPTLEVHAPLMGPCPPMGNPGSTTEVHMSIKYFHQSHTDSQQFASFLSKFSFM